MAAVENDFFGDGTSDLAWFNISTRTLSLWQLDNGTLKYVAYSVAPSLVPVSTGEYSGDNTTDIMWDQQTTNFSSFKESGGTTHQLFYWQMSQGSVAATSPVLATFTDDTPQGTPGIVQNIIPAGEVSHSTFDDYDANGDGKNDLLLYHVYSNGGTTTIADESYVIRNGSLVLIGTAYESSTSPFADSADRTVVGAADDYNKDGTTDIAYNEGSGQYAVRLMSNGQATSTASLSDPYGVNGKLLGAADINGDGFADAVWLNTANGNVSVQLGGYNVNVSLPVNLGTANGNWEWIAEGRYNNAGPAEDFLLRNATTHQLVEYNFDQSTDPSALYKGYTDFSAYSPDNSWYHI